MSHQATPSILENHTSDDNAANADDINSVLPDEILEEILAKLSATSIARVRVGIICNKWKEIAHSTTFLNKFLHSPSCKSWYMVLTAHHGRNQHHGHVYDRALGKWRNFDIPFQIMTSSLIAASALGLICIIPNYEIAKVYVYNPITKLCRRLVDRPTKVSFISCISISVGRNPRSYTVATISSCAHGDLYELVIEVYRSDKLSWETPKEVVVQGCLSSRSRNCVICDGVLYAVLDIQGWRYPPALWAFDLASSSSNDNMIMFPYRLRSSQVMNIKGKLVITTGVEEQSIRGISIWLLKDKELVEVATAPDEYSKCLGLGMLESSIGFDETIYFWDCWTPNILMFDMVSGQWGWTRRRPFSNREIFSGICFEPRFDIMP